MPEEGGFAAGDPQFGEFGVLLGVLESRIERADGVMPAANVGADRILDGGIGGVEGHDVVGGARGDEREVAIDGLGDGLRGRHGFGRYSLAMATASGAVCTAILAA